MKGALRTVLRSSVVGVAVSAGVWLAAPAWAAPSFFSTGNPDGLLGALSRPSSVGKLETETADDFILTDTTTIAQATITGLIPSGTSLANISNVEVELYHVFPADSVNPPSGNVPSRMNSPADVEIGAATRDGSLGTLKFSAALLNARFSVANTVVNGINKRPNNMTDGEGPASGEEVQITITFTPPIVLPADHYFFRPEVQVDGGDFLYLSAPRPIVSPGTPFTGDLQAWIRNSDLAPDWLRIGTDIIGGTPAPTFNMTFSLTGETVPAGLIPGSGPGLVRSDCYVELNVVGIDNPGPDVRGGRVIACTDGDPCDTDGECGNGSCTLSVAVCINQTDPNLAACHPPTGLQKLFVSPKLPAAAVPGSLEGSACGSFVAVPLKQNASVRLSANATAAKGTSPRRDRDTFVLECLPRTTPCPTTSTTTTTTTTTTVPTTTTSTTVPTTTTTVPTTTTTTSSTTTTTVVSPSGAFLEDVSDPAG